MGATVTGDVGIEFDAARGETNDLTVTGVGGMIQLHDANAPVTAGAGCSQVDVHTASCPDTSFTNIFLDDKADHATIVGNLRGVIVEAVMGLTRLPAARVATSCSAMVARTRFMVVLVVTFSPAARRTSSPVTRQVRGTPSSATGGATNSSEQWGSQHAPWRCRQ